MRTLLRRQPVTTKSSFERFLHLIFAKARTEIWAAFQPTFSFPEEQKNEPFPPNSRGYWGSSFRMVGSAAYSILAVQLLLAGVVDNPTNLNQGASNCNKDLDHYWCLELNVENLETTNLILNENEIRSFLFHHPYAFVEWNPYNIFIFLKTRTSIIYYNRECLEFISARTYNILCLCTLCLHCIYRMFSFS